MYSQFKTRIKRNTCSRVRDSKVLFYFAVSQGIWDSFLWLVFKKSGNSSWHKLVQRFVHFCWFFVFFDPENRCELWLRHAGAFRACDTCTVARDLDSAMKIFVRFGSVSSFKLVCFALLFLFNHRGTAFGAARWLFSKFIYCCFILLSLQNPLCVFRRKPRNISGVRPWIATQAQRPFRLTTDFPLILTLGTQITPDRPIF